MRSEDGAGGSAGCGREGGRGGGPERGNGASRLGSRTAVRTAIGRFPLRTCVIVCLNFDENSFI
jgi:hypothetical protein